MDNWWKKIFNLSNYEPMNFTWLEFIIIVVFAVLIIVGVTNGI
jgi:hypothetical protein